MVLEFTEAQDALFGKWSDEEQKQMDAKRQEITKSMESVSSDILNRKKEQNVSVFVFFPL